MALTRKKYVLDKKFQLRISARAVILPLITTLAICGVLLYFAENTNRLIGENTSNITAIIDTQDNMFDMFMAIPALQDPANPAVQKCNAAFKENLKHHEQNQRQPRADQKKQRRSSSTILIAMTVVQTAIIFFQFIFFSHKISGPLHVMTNYLKELRLANSRNSGPCVKTTSCRNFTMNSAKP